MARTIKPNRQFFGVSVDTPAGNTQATSEMLQGLSSVEQRVATLTNTAFDVVDAQMKEQGKQDAIDNPIDLQEWLQSSPKERKNIIKGNTITTKGMATRNMQISLLSSEMEVVYDTAISKLYNEAIKQKISYNDFAAGARDIQAGLLQSLEGTDADTQTKFLGNTNTTNNAYLKSFAAKELEDFQIAQKAKVNLHMSEFLNTKLKVVLSDAYKVRTIDSQTDETKDFPFDEIQDELLEKEVNILIDMRASSEQINSFITKYREKVTQYKKDLLFTRLDTDENREIGARYDAVQGVLDGSFGGNKDSQALYNSLSETEQEDFLKKSIDWAERLNKVTEENAKQKDRVFAETVDTLKTQLLVLETDKTSEMDLEQVYNIKDRLSVIMSPDDFIKFEKTIDAKIDSGIFIDPSMKKIIEDEMDLGVLGLDDLVDAYEKNYISRKTFDKYVKELNDNRSAGVTEAKEILKEFYVPDGLISMDKQLIKKGFLTAKNKLTKFVRENKNASQNEIIAFAENLVEQNTKQNDMQAEKTRIKNKLQKSLQTTKFTNAYNNLYSLEIHKEGKLFDSSEIGSNIVQILNDKSQVNHLKKTFELIQRRYTGEKNNPVVDYLGPDFLEIESLAGFKGDRLHSYSAEQIELLIKDIDDYLELFDE